MTLESARSFLSRIASDEAFRKELAACKTKDEQLAYVRKAGFEFTQDDINTVRNEIQDADLDVVAGGMECCGANEDACQTVLWPH